MKQESVPAFRSGKRHHQAADANKQGKTGRGSIKWAKYTSNRGLSLSPIKGFGDVKNLIETSTSLQILCPCPSSPMHTAQQVSVILANATRQRLSYFSWGKCLLEKYGIKYGEKYGANLEKLQWQGKVFTKRIQQAAVFLQLTLQTMLSPAVITLLSQLRH